MSLQISNAWKAPVSTILSALLGALITFTPTISDAVSTGNFTFDYHALILGFVAALTGALTNFLKEQKNAIDNANNSNTPTK
jgi:hypothetical protein